MNPRYGIGLELGRVEHTDARRLGRGSPSSAADGSGIDRRPPTRQRPASRLPSEIGDLFGDGLPGDLFDDLSLSLMFELYTVERF